MLRSYSPAVAGRTLAPALAAANILHECRRVLSSPGRAVSLLAIPPPRPEANRGVAEQAQGLPRPGGVAAGYPPTPAGKPIAVLLSKRRVLEEYGVPSPGRVMPLLATPYPGWGLPLCC